MTRPSGRARLPFRGPLRPAAARAQHDDGADEQQRHEQHELQPPIELPRLRLSARPRRSTATDVRVPVSGRMCRPGLGGVGMPDPLGVQLLEVDLDCLPAVRGREGRVAVRARFAPPPPAACVAAMRTLAAEELAAAFAE